MSSGKAKSSASSRPIHPAYVPTFVPLGAELSSWAYLTDPRPALSPTVADAGDAGGPGFALPNLVTAHATTLRIYVLDPATGRLVLASTYDDLAGTVISLEVVAGGAGDGGSGGGCGGGPTYDALLLGFAGDPRLSLVYPPTALTGWAAAGEGWSGILTASSIVDLTPALLEACRGGRGPTDVDLVCCVGGGGTSANGARAEGGLGASAAVSAAPTTTAAVVLGGGTAVAAFDLDRTPRPSSASSSSSAHPMRWWRTATEPYVLPLHSLCAALDPDGTSAGGVSSVGKGGKKGAQSSSSFNQNAPRISHGFGDIIDCQYLRGYTEPVLVLLHSNPNRHGGRACSGRLATPSAAGGTRHALTLTAISISVPQRRSVVLWTLRDALPADSAKLISHPVDGVLIVGPNEIIYVDGGGCMRCGVATNGWAKATCPAALIGTPSVTLNGGGESTAAATTPVVGEASVIVGNPSPLPLLAVALDGCRASFLSDDVAALCLRDGTVYSLEIHRRDGSTTNGGGEKIASALSLSPMNFRIGGMGMVSTLSALPLATIGKSVGGYLKDDIDKSVPVKAKLGLIFLGSRMGDSTLLLCGMRERVALVEPDVEDDDKVRAGLKRKRDQNSVRRITILEESAAVSVTDDERAGTSDDEAYRLEEEALYEVPNGDELEKWGQGRLSAIPSSVEDIVTASSKAPSTGRPTITSLSVFDSPAPRPIDCLIGVGPIGPGTIGPTSSAGRTSKGASSTSVHPCGFGNSGGLAVFTMPGMNVQSAAISNETNDSIGGTMLAEVDCRNIANLNGLKRCGLLLVGKFGGGTLIMRVISPGDGSAAADVKIKREEGTNEFEEDPSALRIVEVPLERLTGEDGSGEAMDIGGGDISDADDVTAASILKSAELLQASEWFPTADSQSGRKQKQVERFIVLFVAFKNQYALVILDYPEGGDGIATLSEIHRIDAPISTSSGEDIHLLSTTPMSEQALKNGATGLNIGLVWSHGFGTFISLTREVTKASKKKKFKVTEIILDGHADKESEGGESESEEGVDEDDLKLKRHYESNSIVALDIFEASCNLFSSRSRAESETMTKAAANPDEAPGDFESEFDADDHELYGSAMTAPAEEPSSGADETKSNPIIAPTRVNPMGGSVSSDGPNTSYLAICRMSGVLEIHSVSTFNVKTKSISVSSTDMSSKASTLVWKSAGCGLGVSALFRGAEKGSCRSPRMHKVQATEMRFFFAGGTSDSDTNLTSLRSFCLMVENSIGDVHLYAGSERGDGIIFSRIPNSLVGRPSKEQVKHNLKLRRRGVIAASSATKSSEKLSTFHPNRLHRFPSISRQSGLFAATARPFWVVSERGAPTFIQHRARHVAPAGGKDVPVASFCCDIMPRDNGDGGYLTLHERIGHVGSQRITMFDSLSDVFSPLGLFPGSGVCIQKIPLGVTVRCIEFIDDATISSAARPLYAVLISRETEADQSHLDTDGMTTEERETLQKEKEEEKTRRQVEADLGGFEIEQEWVEEIERDDYFEIDTSLGRAPPLPKRLYELWLVDAASGWKVVARHQFDESEQGASMEVMELTELIPETESASSSNIDVNEGDNDLFVVVGTGIIDKDGEDVSSKGKIRLFSINRHTQEDIDEGKPLAAMEEVYYKDMSLGPVTSLCCLQTEGKNRLVVGCGAEITIEQWTGGKLVQVGFFHVNMQVQRISLFKTFFMLSDAYDSLHFLVWRESDKSLTLLAKDYDPVALYATGLMSRGGAMSFVCHDDRENLQFLQYAPTDAASRGGNKLVCRADFHLGAQTTALQSHWCRSSLLINSATPNSTLAALKQQDPLFGRIDDDQRFAVHFGSSDGGFGSLVPLSEQTYWRLTALQSVMCNALDSNCALSNRAWRLFRRSARRGGCRSSERMKGVIDGEHISKYANLSLMEQEDLASAIGSTVELIVDNILELQCAGMVT